MGEVCEELKTWMIDVYCVLKVSWRGQGARMEGWRYRLWSSGKWDVDGGVGVMVKDELCEKVVKVGIACDGVMAVMLVFEEDVLSLMCGYARQSG